MIASHIGTYEQSEYICITQVVNFNCVVVFDRRLYEEAADIAFEQRDRNTLYVIQQKSSMLGNRQLLDKINTNIALLSSKR